MSVVTLDDLLPSWRRHLRAKNLAPRTIHSYLDSAEQLNRWLCKQNANDLDSDGPNSSVDGITQRLLEDYLAETLERTSPGHAATQYRRLQQLFRWLVDEEELDDSPLRRLAPPQVPDKPVPVLQDDTIRALLDSCRGRRFEDRRDDAILRVLVDCGLRAGELTGLTVGDLDLDYSVVTVLGKGRRLRSVPFGARTGAALDRYVRARRRHRFAELDALWLGAKGRLSASGVQQMVDRRCGQAGVGHVHLHQFRHTAASNWLALGGQEGDLERLMGWSQKSGMTRRYGASEADRRAAQAHKRLAPGDRF